MGDAITNPREKKINNKFKLKNHIAYVTRSDPLIKIIYRFGGLGPMVLAPNQNRQTERQTDRQR